MNFFVACARECLTWLLWAATGFSIAGFSAAAHGADWNPRTTDWSANPAPVAGDWGFNRPGYPEGLYIHGITVKGGEAVTNPVIYDNDVFDDTFDDEWAFVMASLRKMNLAGLIITPLLTPEWGFYHEEWKKTGTEAYDLAVASGMHMDRIPKITFGTEADTPKAAEGKDSAGARLYIQVINDQYKKDPTRPVIINIGGQSATLASAYTIDSGIADKCIVYYTDLIDYNAKYTWASELVASHFRVINFGAQGTWWMTKKQQTQWNVLPRPAHPQAKDNDADSGEWKLLTDMHVPILDRMVYQFQHRQEFCGGKPGDPLGDGYLDGTFIHAWLPGIFSDARIETIRTGKVLNVTKFTEANEALVKQFTLKTLLNPEAYGKPGL